MLYDINISLNNDTNKKLLFLLVEKRWKYKEKNVF